MRRPFRGVRCRRPHGAAVGRCYLKGLKPWLILTNEKPDGVPFGVKPGEEELNWHKPRERKSRHDGHEIEVEAIERKVVKMGKKETESAATSSRDGR